MTNFLNYFSNRQNEILKLIRELVEIESPSLDIKGSVEAVGWMEAEAKKLKSVSTIERIYREGYGEHLILRAFEDLNEKPLLLLGHLDTVHPRGSLQNNPTRIESDKFYGCGIFDMKANAVVMLEILRSFEELNLLPTRPVNILLSCDEEIGSDTGREIVETEARKAAFCLVGEPSADGRVKTGRKGTGWFNLKAHGIPAHAGLEPQKGASAILELAKQIQKLQSFNDFETGTTVNVCTMKGGTTSNVIPEYAECEIDVRFSAMSEAERINDEIKNLKSFDSKVELKLEGGINRPPLERSKAVMALYEKAAAIARRMNYEFGETQVGGASDGNFVGAMNVPVLDGLGIRGDGAHTNFEHISISDIAPRSALLAQLILEL